MLLSQELVKMCTLTPKSPIKKYICIGVASKTCVILAEWLPRWYKVPYKECLFYNQLSQHRPAKTIDQYIHLTYRVKNDYVKYLKILKTNQLLQGN